MDRPETVIALWRAADGHLPSHRRTETRRVTTRRSPWLCLLLLIASVGCASKPATPSVPAASSVKDSLGRTVSLPKLPERIVSLAPAATEILFAVGLGPKVVAVTTFDNFPEDVKALPKVGGFSSSTISLEAIVGQRPDLVVCAGSLQQPTMEALEKLGIPAFASEPTTFAETVASMAAIGEVCGTSEKATVVVADFRKRLDDVKRRAAAATAAKPQVLFVVGVEPLLAAGPKTFLGEAIELAGGRNLLVGVPEQYPRVSEELLFAKEPDLILGLSGEHGGVVADLAKRPSWVNLKAVKAGRIVAIPDDLIARAGPRLIEGLEAVERAIRAASTP